MKGQHHTLIHATLDHPTMTVTSQLLDVSEIYKTYTFSRNDYWKNVLK